MGCPPSVTFPGSNDVCIRFILKVCFLTDFFLFVCVFPSIDGGVKIE